MHRIALLHYSTVYLSESKVCADTANVAKASSSLTNKKVIVVTTKYLGKSSYLKSNNGLSL